MRLGAMGGTPSRVRDHPTAGNQHVGLLALLCSSSCRPNAKIVLQLRFAIEKTLLYISWAAREEVPHGL